MMLTLGAATLEWCILQAVAQTGCSLLCGGCYGSPQSPISSPRSWCASSGYVGSFGIIENGPVLSKLDSSTSVLKGGAGPCAELIP